MKKTTKILAAVAVLALGGVAAQAQLTYYDALDFNYGTTDTGLPFTLYDASGVAPFATVGLSDAVGEWRYRGPSGSIGPGGAAWNTNVYDLRYTQQDPDGIQRITGLVPNSAYEVRVYGVYPSNPSSRHGAIFSFDGGATWQGVDNQTDHINWVDASTPLGSYLPAASGDTRFWSHINMTAYSDASGTLDILIRAPEFLQNGQAQDRFNLDGFALQVPEPATFALAGLGTAALLIFRRRR